MIRYDEIVAGDRLKIVGMGAPGFAKLGDTVIVVSTNGKNRCDVRHEVTGEEAYFALTCGAERLEPIPALDRPANQSPEHDPLGIFEP